MVYYAVQVVSYLVLCIDNIEFASLCFFYFSNLSSRYPPLAGSKAPPKFPLGALSPYASLSHPFTWIKYIVHQIEPILWFNSGIFYHILYSSSIKLFILYTTNAFIFRISPHKPINPAELEALMPPKSKWDQEPSPGLAAAQTGIALWSAEAFSIQL